MKKKKQTHTRAHTLILAHTHAHTLSHSHWSIFFLSTSSFQIRVCKKKWKNFFAKPFKSQNCWLWNISFFDASFRATFISAVREWPQVRLWVNWACLAHVHKEENQKTGFHGNTFSYTLSITVYNSISLSLSHTNSSIKPIFLSISFSFILSFLFALILFHSFTISLSFLFSLILWFVCSLILILNLIIFFHSNAQAAEPPYFS